MGWGGWGGRGGGGGGGGLIEDLRYTGYFFFSNSLKALFLSENLVS